MNITIANEVYRLHYLNEMAEEHFLCLLQKGIELLERNQNIDRRFLSRIYNSYDDLRALNIAMRYNQELMIQLLRE